jgi:hypothetical protein
MRKKQPLSEKYKCKPIKEMKNSQVGLRQFPGNQYHQSLGLSLTISIWDIRFNKFWKISIWDLGFNEFWE